MLQGLITCGVCGHVFRADRQQSFRYYSCRGKLKSHHVNGSPRCQNPTFNASWLEDEVWQKTVELLNDPNKLSHVIQDAIEELKVREDELSAKIKPIDERLVQIASQKAKLADDWVIKNMNRTRFQDIQQDLESEETRLRAVKSNIDPAQIQELEQSRGMLRFWEEQLKAMGWNTEDQDGKMERTVDQPHEAVLKLVNLEGQGTDNKTGFPNSRRQLLDKLQVRLTAMPERIEVKALFPLAPIQNQLCTSPRG